ncbi:MAG TPA: nicotinate phosphoribosyltransferase, partial [Acidilobales archaeon]|nr:nicotinate phosphoribosyltransferase [Acidilobales archaeon]
MRKLYIASEDEILSGEVTDIYFIRTKEILKKYDLDKVKVRVEVHASLPKGYEWGVFTGLEEA